MSPWLVRTDLRVALRVLLGCLVFAVSPLLICPAQAADTSDEVGVVAWDGKVQVFGALRAIFHENDTATQVGLDSLAQRSHLYGLGALTDLVGEVTILDGKAYVSYPQGAANARTEVYTGAGAGATLLVLTEVANWKSYEVKESIAFEDLDGAIAALAAQAGMDLDERLPFLIDAECSDLQWHVVDGERLAGGGDTHEDHLAAAARLRAPRSQAQLLGFFSRRDQGVFTHRGSHTHLHCLLQEPLRMGHVDHVTIPAGARIRFPATAAAATDAVGDAATEKRQ